MFSRITLLNVTILKILSLVAKLIQLILMILDSIFERLDRCQSYNTGFIRSITVENGVWWYAKDNLARGMHTYFSRPNDGRLLANSLFESEGSNALLIAAYYRIAILLSSQAGMIITSGRQWIDRELSSGSRRNSKRIVFIRDGFVAIQRNSANYGHFTTEVLPSIVAWETSSLSPSNLIITKSPFAESLLRLIGYQGIVTQISSPSIMLARNVTVLRLLPAGSYNPQLLKEIARRAHSNAIRRNIIPQKVVLLLRPLNETRRLVNEFEVIFLIKEKYPNVDVFYPGVASVEEQVVRMTNAKIVIATHGSHAINMIWATEMEKFVEISYFGDGKICFRALANALGASAYYVNSHPIKANDAYADHYCDMGDLKSVLSII
jgi:hypothetical protein